MPFAMARSMKRSETLLCPARVVVGALRGPFETGLLRRRPPHARKGSLVLLGAWWSGLGPCRAQSSVTFHMKSNFHFSSFFSSPLPGSSFFPDVYMDLASYKGRLVSCAPPPKEARVST